MLLVLKMLKVPAVLAATMYELVVRLVRLISHVEHLASVTSILASLVRLELDAVVFPNVLHDLDGLVDLEQVHSLWCETYPDLM